MFKRLQCLLLLCLTLLCAGCGGGEAALPAASSAPAQSQAEPAPVPEPDPQPEVPAGTNPLTGLPMDPAWENRRPVAVMLNNLKAAQPQLGVSRADVIYEIPAEGGITRMLALYQSLDGVGELGSVRSTRPCYLEAALGHDALLVHAGGSEAAYSDIYSWKVDNMDGVRGGSDADVFWRDPDRKKNNGYEHSLLTSGENILSYLDGGRFRLEHEAGWTAPQVFAEDGTPEDGDRATRVTVKFSYYKTGVFDYDHATETYLASQYDAPYTDGETGDQVAARNLLVLYTSMKVLDSEGRLSVKLTGEGEGQFFCGGKTAGIRWSKADRNSPFVYTGPDGKPLALGQGRTYVCIIDPKTGALAWS